jgi:hypothetical protein
MNNLENNWVLSNKLLSAIDLILERTPNVVFGGSIALNAVGLIRRKIKDIDLFFPLTENFSNNTVLCMSTASDISSETTTDINGLQIERVGAKIGDVHICCFKVPDEFLQSSRITFLGRTLNIQNVNQAIIAKRVYAEMTSNKKGHLYIQNSKHKDDLDKIYSTLNELLN